MSSGAPAHPRHRHNRVDQFLFVNRILFLSVEIERDLAELLTKARGCPFYNAGSVSPWSNRSEAARVLPGYPGIAPLRTCDKVSGDNHASSIAWGPPWIICCRKKDCLRPVASASTRNLCSMTGSMRTATTFILIPALLINDYILVARDPVIRCVGRRGHLGLARRYRPRRLARSAAPVAQSRHAALQHAVYHGLNYLESIETRGLHTRTN
ncbi:hypothetical protein AWB81_05860 [Caballeronia arationis]|nr:hypothetical protein AWB81_05860 [Caballeronia arationis]